MNLARPEASSCLEASGLRGGNLDAVDYVAYRRRSQVSLLSSLQIGGTRQHQAKNPWSHPARLLPGGRLAMTYTIFEGTSEIQRLVIARSISGVHIP